jgi:hypothetical protein
MQVKNFVELFGELCEVYPELIEQADKCFSLPANFASFGISKVELRNTILEQIALDKKIIFHGSKETFDLTLINNLQDIVDSIPVVTNRLFYTIGCKDYQQAYDKFKMSRSIKNKFIFISYNYWEHWTISTHRHTEYIPYDVRIKEKKFFCLNRTERLHRLYLYAHSIKHNWFSDSYFSFVGTSQDYISYFVKMANDILHHAEKDSSFSKPPLIQNWVADEIEKTKHYFPILLDENNVYIKVNERKAELFNNSYVSIITETLFEDTIISPFFQYHYIGGYNFLTEKTFKCIVSKHPFILVSRNGSLEYLKSLGYKTFHPYINESYDEIVDDKLRMDAITTEILRLNNFSDSEWLIFQKNVKDIIEHNYKVLSSKTDFRITKINDTWFGDKI